MFFRADWTGILGWGFITGKQMFPRRLARFLLVFRSVDDPHWGGRKRGKPPKKDVFL
jgi:hypothetical protein